MDVALASYSQSWRNKCVQFLPPSNKGRMFICLIAVSVTVLTAKGFLRGRASGCCRKDVREGKEV